MCGFQKKNVLFLAEKCMNYSKWKSVHCLKLYFLSEARSMPKKEDMLLAEIRMIYKTMPPSVLRQLGGWLPGTKKNHRGTEL